MITGVTEPAPPPPAHQPWQAPVPIQPAPPVTWQQPPPPATWEQPGVPPTLIPLNSRFEFDGGAATYVATAIAGFVVIVLTIGICTPWAIVMRYRWRTKHTLIHGYRLRFTGTAPRLFGMWIKWWLLIIVTLGIYGFWVAPRLTRWITRHQEFDLTAQRVTN